MTRNKDGSDICDRKLRVHLSRLKTPTHHTNCGKSLTKQGVWEHNPFVKLCHSPFRSYNADTAEELAWCGLSPTDNNSNGTKKYPCLIINGKSPTLALTKIPGHHKAYRLGSQCMYNENGSCDVSLDKYSEEAKFDQPPRLMREVCPSFEQSQSAETDGHLLKKGHMLHRRRRGGHAVRGPALSNQTKSRLNMRLGFQRGSIFRKRNRRTGGSRILRTKLLFSSFDGGRKNVKSSKNKVGSTVDKIVSLPKKLVKHNKHKFKGELIVTVKPDKMRSANLTPPVLLDCHQNKEVEKPIMEDIIEVGDSLEKFKRRGDFAFKEHHQIMKRTCITNEITGSRHANHEEIRVGGILKKKEGPEGRRETSIIKKGRLLYSSGVKKCKNDLLDKVSADDNSSTMVQDSNKLSLLKHPPKVEQSTTPEVRSKMTSANKTLLTYHNNIEKLKAELKTIHRKKEDEKRELRRESPLKPPSMFNRTDYNRTKLSLTLRLSPCTSPQSQRTPVEEVSDVRAKIQKMETDTTDMPKLIAESMTVIDGEPDDDNNDADDDDVIIESITTPKALKRTQITSCISDFLDYSKISEAPTLEEVNEKLKSVFGQKINTWKQHVEEQYVMIMTGGSAPPSLPIQQDIIMVTVGRYAISQTDLASLDDDTWVNDNIINAYFQLITEVSSLKIFPMSSFFYQVYCSNGFSHVQRWHRKIDIFSHQIILIPVHSQHHWCFVAVNTDTSTITFYDSIRQSGQKYLQKIMTYMKEEASARGIEPVEWSLKNSIGIPQQRNYSDCGVFVCQYAKRLGFNKHVQFSHREAAEFRREMKLELLAKHLEKCH